MEFLTSSSWLNISSGGIYIIRSVNSDRAVENTTMIARRFLASGEKQDKSSSRGERNVVAFRINMHNLNDARVRAKRVRKKSGGSAQRERDDVEGGCLKEAKRGDERKDTFRRDSRNSYSCLTTTRHSIMQRLALVHEHARATVRASPGVCGS